MEVHRQVHKDNNGKEWITLKGREVCPSAWQTIHAISRATYYRYKEMATLGKQAEGHGNLGSKKPRMHTMQAIATLRVMIGDDADRMPNKTRTLNSGERVSAMVLPSMFRWKDQLPQINDANAALNLKPISASNLSRIWKSRLQSMLRRDVEIALLIVERVMSTSNYAVLVRRCLYNGRSGKKYWRTTWLDRRPIENCTMHIDTFQRSIQRRW